MTKGSLKPEIIYEDPNLLIINKPPGLLSVPNGYDPGLPYLKVVLEPEFGPLWLVHRLDKETSGVMVLARNAEAHRKLNQSFRERIIGKIYHGLVTPSPQWQEKVIDFPLKVNADRRHRTRVNYQDGKPAWTSCKVLTRGVQAVLMEFNIKTGITHQIRAHLRENELILIGERLYNAGLGFPPISAPRMMLHARELTLPYPRKDESMTFTAPYPEDFRNTYTLIRTTTNPDAVI
jgi:tRNA pseudouridine32 synthase/23S rRNA pseudouridine746 synthase